MGLAKRTLTRGGLLRCSVQCRSTFPYTKLSSRRGIPSDELSSQRGAQGRREESDYFEDTLMKTTRVLKFRQTLVAAALSLGAAFGMHVAMAADAGKDQAELVKALPKAKVSLIDGLRQATKAQEIPISAKFEFDDGGKLSLSVYTAEKGLRVDAEHNVLKELSGSPEQDKWTPKTEVFKDIPHVARSSEQLALASLSSSSLADIVSRAQKEHPGTVFSITPGVRNHKPVFVVLKADKGKVTEHVYGVMDGKAVQAQK